MRRAVVGALLREVVEGRDLGVLPWRAWDNPAWMAEELTRRAVMVPSWPSTPPVLRAETYPVPLADLRPETDLAVITAATVPVVLGIRSS